MTTPEQTVLQGVPYSKMKPGMRVRLTGGLRQEGRILQKRNADKSLFVLLDPAPGETQAPGEGTVWVLAAAVEVLPPDPFDQIHPMLAKNVDDFKSYDVDSLMADPAWGAEEKFDGERQILSYLPLDSGYYGKHAVGGSFFPEFDMGFRATTRVVGLNTGTLGENTATLRHLAGLPVPPHGVTVFDAELLHPKGFQTLRSIMGSLPALALEKQGQLGLVTATLFDVLWFDGKDLRGMPFVQRRKVLATWYEEACAWLSSDPALAAQSQLFAQTVQLSRIEWGETGKRQLADAVKARGGEGLMLKHAMGRYTDTTLPGKRSADVLKVKPFTETDAILVGFGFGEGMYNTDRFGRIHLAQWVRLADVGPKMMVLPAPHPNIVELEANPIEGHVLVAIGSASGFTQAQEAAFRADPDAFIGKAVEVTYQQRWPDTALLRHPNFVRMRDDKSAYDCVYVP